MELGFQQYNLDSFGGQSFDGISRETESVVSAHSPSTNSGPIKFTPTSKRVFRALKDCARKLSDVDLFTQSLEDWVLENSFAETANEEHCFKSPFSIDELRTLDFALEWVLFQQLHRMPCYPHVSDNVKEDQYLSLQDFLHTIGDCLWRTFWYRKGPSPFLVVCPRYAGSKFYTLEKAILRGRLDSLSGAALIPNTGSDQQVHWDQVVQFALFRPNILMEKELKLSSSSICEALFYGIRILLSRTLSKYSTASNDCVFVLVLDSSFGGVVKLGGDLGKLELSLGNPYLSIVQWIKFHAEISVSQVDRIWNKLGNANWRDLGTLQLLLATFYSIANLSGPPRKSLASLASDHSLRLQKRRMERRVVFEGVKAVVPLQMVSNHHGGEIVKVDCTTTNPSFGKKESRLKLQQGEVLELEDQEQGQRSFQVQDSLHGWNSCCYSAVAVECPMQLLTLYVGAHQSCLEPSWEDMSLWYQVQRQTKVLNIFKEQGISSKHLPEIVASGRILHSGPCNRQSPKGRCNHPLCGTPVLLVYPVGEPITSKVSREGPFSSEDTIRCCRDCLAALRSARMANVQHGDICPDNIIITNFSEDDIHLHVLVSWGRAVLEEKDSCAAVNLQFSSAFGLQHGKLCPSSDIESLVYLLFYISGGTMPTQEEVDSIESALQWRQRSWEKRVIQQHLGQVSPLLQAFADYVDSLCGTPYLVDYDVWLERLSRAADGSADRGKVIEQQVLRLEDVPGSSGTSKDDNSVS